jgi:pimeloyl-ACP methyl ester carboxylesterase
MVPATWDAYTSDALTALIKRVLDERCENRQLILVGHSLGTLLVGRLALVYGEKCLASVLLSPRALISEGEIKFWHYFSKMPQFIFDFMRWRDRAYPLPGFPGLMR